MYDCDTLIVTRIVILPICLENKKVCVEHIYQSLRTISVTGARESRTFKVLGLHIREKNKSSERSFANYFVLNGPLSF